MKKYLVLLLMSLSISALAQKTGMLNYTITLDDGGTVTVNQPFAQFKYNDYRDYWFTKPNKTRYAILNAVNMGVVMLHTMQNDTDVIYRDKHQGDQISFEGKYQGKTFTLQPDNDKVPVHVQYTTFTPGELGFNFSGPVKFRIELSKWITGTVKGTLHVYRDARYEKSDTAPNCNCDPNIYASFYDPEIGRTPSACENAVLWRVYNTLHPALYPLLSLDQTQQYKSAAPAGTIMYRKDGSKVDITEPMVPANACNADNKDRAVVSIDAHTRLFTERNDYAMGFIRTVNTDALSTQKADPKDLMKRSAAVSDSIMKLVMAKKISPDQASKVMNAKLKEIQGGVGSGPDVKQLETYNHLDVLVAVNQVSQPLTLDDNIEIQHNVAGAAFEVYKKSIKDGDGNWTPFIKYVFFGKFNITRQGNRVTGIVPVYNAAGNKLTLFNAVVQVRGGQDLVDQAMGLINFSSIPAILNNN